jgi:hypothetical protein
LDIDGKPHTVELEHGVFSGKRVLRVDGQAVIQTKNVFHLLFDTGGSYPISFGGHKGEVRLRLWALSFLGFRYELVMDNVLVPYLPVRKEPSGCLILWLIFVLVGNSIGICSNLAAIILSGASRATIPAWVLIVGTLFSLTYLGLVLASRWLEKWAILLLYGLSILVIPVNFISYLYLFHPSGIHGLMQISLLIVPVLLSLVSWLLGILGIVILACLLQGSGYLVE